MQEALSVYDTNGDETFSIDDIHTIDDLYIVPPQHDRFSDQEKRAILHRRVADAFEKYAGFSKAQNAGMRRLFDLYNDMKLVAEQMKEWRKNDKTTEGEELKVSADYWHESVLPFFVDDGVLAPIAGSRFWNGENIPLVSSLLFVFANLQNQSNRVAYGTPNISYLCGSVIGLAYNQTRIPLALQEPLNDIHKWNDSIRVFKKDFTEIECEGEGCNDFASHEQGLDLRNWHFPVLRPQSDIGDGKWLRSNACPPLI